MEVSRRTVSKTELEAEWKEIQAAQSDRAQFRPLYDRYYEAIFRFVLRRTNEESLTADLCGRIFLNAMQRLDSYEYRAVPFSAWLYRIASNEVAMHYRKVGRKRTVSLENVQLINLVEEESTPDRYEARQAWLLEALDQLKEADMQILELRFFEQRSFKEVAGILDITENNAKVRTYRVLQRLKKILAQSKQNLI